MKKKSPKYVKILSIMKQKKLHMYIDLLDETHLAAVVSTL